MSHNNSREFNGKYHRYTHQDRWSRKQREIDYLKDKLRSTSEESSKEKGSLKKTIKDLEATKMRLEEQVSANTLTNTSLKQQLNKLNLENQELNKQMRANRNSFEMKWQKVCEEFGELERMHKLNGDRMMSIQSSLSSNVNTSQRSQTAGTLTQTLDGNDSYFACQICNNRYKLKSSLNRHLKDKHMEDSLLLSSANKRTKSRANTLK